MTGYTASSMTASTLSPFITPPNTTTPEAGSDQAAAVSQAVAQPAGNTAQTAASTTSQLGSATAASQTVGQTTTSAGVLTPSAAPLQAATLQDLLPTPSTPWWQMGPGDYTVALKWTSGLAYFSNGIPTFWAQLAQQLTFGPGGSTAGALGAWYPTPQFASLGLGNLGGVGHVSAISAGAGQAARIGALSVPQHWATLTSAVSPATLSEEAAPIQAAATGGANSPANGLLRGMPVGSVGRRGAAAGYVNKYGFRYSVLTRPPSAG
jgi:PPE-repeat protein